jgi:hypothetical protein
MNGYMPVPLALSGPCPVTTFKWARVWFIVVLMNVRYGQ